jgi:hypothetical protein
VTRPESALKARSGIAAQTYPNSCFPADRNFASRRPPAWTVIEARREPISATEIRGESVNPH